MSMDELANVKGRGWEDIDVRGMTLFLFADKQKLTPIAALSHGAIQASELVACRVGSSEHPHCIESRYRTENQGPKRVNDAVVRNPTIEDKIEHLHRLCRC